MSNARPPRFPYAAALLCAACLGAAAWTWMRYSYAWPMMSCDLILKEHDGKMANIFDPEFTPSWIGKYATVTGVVTSRNPVSPRFIQVVPPSRCCSTCVWLPEHQTPSESDRTVVTYSGRMVDRVEDGSKLYGAMSFIIDTTASRFTGASIAGLVVGAMGVFVFTLALRHWLGERRKLREGAIARANGLERPDDARPPGGACPGDAAAV